MSVSSFDNMKTITYQVNYLKLTKTHHSILKAKNILDCAQKCVHYANTGGYCNAYSHDNNSLDCDLASLTYLEDPLPDGSDGGEKKIMV